MARWDPLREFALILAMAVPGFVACALVFLAIDPIARGRWRLWPDAAGLTLAAGAVAAYALAGAVVASASRDPDFLWGGCGIVLLFSTGILLPVWVGLGQAAADQEPGFALVLWTQPLIAVTSFQLGARAARGVRRLARDRRP
jgi:hypothetical protein